MFIKTGLLVLVEQPKQMVALRPPPVADKGSNALSEITSNRKHIYVQRIATIFQTAERDSPLQYDGCFAVFIKFVLTYSLYYYLRASDERPY